MQLLVSVADAADAKTAVAGGADIVDAKDPTRGALGPVAPEVLAQLDAAVPAHLPFSVALGETDDPGAGARWVTDCVMRPRIGAVYAKLAATASCPGLVGEVIAGAVAAAAAHPARPFLVAALFADRVGDGASVRPLLAAVAAAGASGILWDTAEKDGRGLFAHWPVPVMREWADAARSEGLWVAVAGALGLDDLDAVRMVSPRVLGVRGAVCEGGRSGTVSEALVRRLAEAVGQAPSSAERRAMPAAPITETRSPLGTTEANAGSVSPAASPSTGLTSTR